MYVMGLEQRTHYSIHERFKMKALTYCDAEDMSTRTTAGQFKGQFKGAMEKTSPKFRR